MRKIEALILAIFLLAAAVPALAQMKMETYRESCVLSSFQSQQIDLIFQEEFREVLEVKSVHYYNSTWIACHTLRTSRQIALIITGNGEVCVNGFRGDKSVVASAARIRERIEGVINVPASVELGPPLFK